MDTTTVGYVLWIFCALPGFIIISGIIFFCCFCGVNVYSQGYLSTIDEEIPAIRMSEFTGYSKRNLSTINEETGDGNDQERE